MHPCINLKTRTQICKIICHIPYRIVFALSMHSGVNHKLLDPTNLLKLIVEVFVADWLVIRFQHLNYMTIKPNNAMIDQLMKLVRENAGDEIINNPAIPNEKNDEAVREVGQSIIGGLKDQISSGNIQQLVSMFSGGAASGSNPVVSQLISSVAGGLASKLGLSPQTATQIASGLLPKVLSQFVNKAKDPNDKDFDLQDILSNLGGGSGNIGELLGGLTGSSGKGGLGGALGKMFGG